MTPLLFFFNGQSEEISFYKDDLTHLSIKLSVSFSVGGVNSVLHTYCIYAFAKAKDHELARKVDGLSAG